MRVTREQVLDEIRRTAAENNGEAPGYKRFASNTGIREYEWRGYWPRWSDALLEAGFQPNEMVGSIDNDAVFLALASEVQRLGRMPTWRERGLRHREDPSFPSDGVFRRIGSKRDLARALTDYCREHAEFADVLAIVEPLVAQPTRPESKEADGRHEVVFGFVYMLKSGRNYKVGRSNSVGRREYELAIQLPERATLVHQIKAYWHRRFADRRKNGEWFALTAEDVRAFRRRKFM